MAKIISLPLTRMLLNIWAPMDLERENLNRLIS
jgi:hypothetical protein